MEREKIEIKLKDKSLVQPIDLNSSSLSKRVSFGIFNVGHQIQENMRIAKAEEKNNNQQ